MKRTTARTWALVAVQGGKQTLVDESKTLGRRRALIEFERRHRITIIDPDEAALLRQSIAAVLGS